MNSDTTQDLKESQLKKDTALNAQESLAQLEQAIGYALPVASSGNMIKSLYYKLTSRIPRRMPITAEEWARLKSILVTHFKVKDDPIVWYSLASQVTGTKPTLIHKAYIHYANAAKRLEINELAQDQKKIAGLEISRNLKLQAQEMIDKATKESMDEPGRVPSGASDIQTPVPELPQSPERVVSVFKEPGLF